MFNKFDLIWMLTEGGPGYATTTLPLLAYQETFQGDHMAQERSAVMMFLILALSAILYFKAASPSQEAEV